MRVFPLLLVTFAGCPSPSKDSGHSQLSAQQTSRGEAPPPKSADEQAPASPSDARCETGMVHVAPATFTMGTAADDPGDMAHQVTITNPYCIDRTSVTVAEYRKCVEAKSCSEPHKPLDYNYGRVGREDHPVNGVTWAQADAYCRWANKRLPTDAEWELAARGTDHRKYPWGNEEPDDTRLWWSRTEEREGTSPVALHPAGASPYGAQDMLGNVSQWVADFGENFTANAQTDPHGPDHGELKVVRGGSYDMKLGALLVGKRYAIDPGMYSGSTGFRCARAVR